MPKHAQPVVRHRIDPMLPVIAAPVAEVDHVIGRLLALRPLDQAVGRALGDGDVGRVGE